MVKGSSRIQVPTVAVVPSLGGELENALFGEMRVGSQLQRRRINASAYIIIVCGICRRGRLDLCGLDVDSMGNKVSTDSPVCKGDSTKPY